MFPSRSRQQRTQPGLGQGQGAAFGCLAWRREGMTAPKAIADATAAYQAEFDPLREFVGECCVFDNFAWVARADLYNAYTEWADDAGEKYPLGRRSFFERTRQLEGVNEDRRKITGKAMRIFMGIGLQSQVPVRGDTW